MHCNIQEQNQNNSAALLQYEINRLKDRLHFLDDATDAYREEFHAERKSLQKRIALLENGLTRIVYNEMEKVGQ